LTVTVDYYKCYIVHYSWLLLQLTATLAGAVDCYTMLLPLCWLLQMIVTI